MYFDVRVSDMLLKEDSYSTWNIKHWLHWGREEAERVFMKYVPCIYLT